MKTSQNDMNREHKNGNNSRSVAIWLPIGAGVGAALGAALATVTGRLGTFGGIGTCMALMGVGVAAGMMVVAVFAMIQRKRS